MKISKSLLSAIAAGLVMTAVTSCDKSEVINERGSHTEQCPENCTDDRCDDNRGDGHTWDCPGCGMG